MRTTHTRGPAHSNTDSVGAVFPPHPRVQVARYQQPPRQSRSGIGWLGRIALILVLAAVALAAGIGGGLFLWFHQSLLSVSSNAPGLKRAEKDLDLALPGQPTIALVLGDNQRAGFEASAGRSS